MDGANGFTPPDSPRNRNGPEVEVVEPTKYENQKFFYEKVWNAEINPVVRNFFALKNDRIAKRFCQLHPEADSAAVDKILNESARYFQWAGADLFRTTTSHGRNRMVVIETNSCPSGQKSMPMFYENMELAGYRTLLEKSLIPHLQSKTYNGNPLPEGKLAVLYDKNKMEASGYAAALAELAKESVYLIPCYENDLNPKMRVREDGILEICTYGGLMQSSNDNSNNNNNQVWEPVRAAVRYVTQRPWTRIPPITRTLVFNPVLVCLAGGRNKMLAAKAYDLYNEEIRSSGLRIYTPKTIWDVSKDEVESWVEKMGGRAVVKVPYSNAGQGVWTITNRDELEKFMKLEHHYDRFIVQVLIGNNGWSSEFKGETSYHVGTIPDQKRDIYAADLRMMIGSSSEGFFPLAIYGRKARLPLAEKLDGGATPSWDMLGTNLSVKNSDGSWGKTQTERLLVMDTKDFNVIGMGLDDLIEAYIQTVLAVTAIDDLARKLITSEGQFSLKLFKALNPDTKLSGEIYSTKGEPHERQGDDEGKNPGAEVTFTLKMSKDELLKLVSNKGYMLTQSNIEQVTWNSSKKI